MNRFRKKLEPHFSTRLSRIGGAVPRQAGDVRVIIFLEVIITAENEPYRPSAVAKPPVPAEPMLWKTSTCKKVPPTEESTSEKAGMNDAKKTMTTAKVKPASV